MFPKSLRTLILALVVAIGGMAASTASSNAGSGYLEFGAGGSGIYFSSGRGYRSHNRRYDRYDRRNRRYNSQRRYGRGVCAPRRALQKARRMGVRHARIARVNQRVVVVKGFRYGDRAKVKFGRSRRCPVIAFRNINY